MNHRYALGIIFMFLIFAAGCGAADPEQISMEETTGFHTLDPEQLAEIMEEALDDDDLATSPISPTPADLTEATAATPDKPTLTKVPSGSLDAVQITANDPLTNAPEIQNIDSYAETPARVVAGIHGRGPQVSTTVGFKAPSPKDREEYDAVVAGSVDSDDFVREEDDRGDYQLDGYATTFASGKIQEGPTLELDHNNVSYQDSDDCEENDRDCSDD